MKVGIFAAESPLTQQLLGEIERGTGHTGVRFDPAFSGEGLVLDAQRFLLDDVNLTALGCVWVHGSTFENPVIPAPQELFDWSVWNIGYLADQQKQSARFSLLQELTRRGIKVVNPPAVHCQNFMKFAWLESLRSAGFKVPDLLCTNDPQSAATFRQKADLVIWRPATGRATWQRFREKQQNAFANPQKPPILLARVVPGPLARAYLMGGKVVLCLQHRPPAFTPPLESLEQLWSVPGGDAVPTLERLARENSLEWGVITFIPSARGPYIFDLDADPILDWLPEAFRDFLIATLARFLTGRDMEEHPLPPENVLDRPNLFLRRMLRLPFQFEHSKHP